MRDKNPLNYNTLKFLVEFFQELVQYEPHNKMTSYNIAVTVCPVIFRPRIQQADEIIGVSTFYDAFIRMIDNYHYLFNADDRFCNQANPVPRASDISGMTATNDVVSNVASVAPQLLQSEVQTEKANDRQLYGSVQQSMEDKEGGGLEEYEVEEQILIQRVQKEEEE